MSKIPLMLAVNDENGNHTGRAEAAEVADLIYLEGGDLAVPCRVENRYTLVVGELRCKLEGYTSYVGNILWDCAWLEGEEVARIVEMLRARGWGCTEAETSLFDAYTEDRPITGEMIERVYIQ